jgi:hypothetical protein
MTYLFGNLNLFLKKGPRKNLKEVPEKQGKSILKQNQKGYQKAKNGYK